MNLISLKPEPTTLELRCTFSADRQRVFRAWTEPELLKRWAVPNPGAVCDFVEVDLRVGGEYRIGMPASEGGSYIAFGVYQEVDPPARLVYTWRWEHLADNIPDSLVTVEFIEKGDQTEVRLRHEQFVDEATRDAHLEGWDGCFKNLEKLFAKN